ncbi:hypothetical protein ACH41E_30190 [Streptomyces sp. NPDC020412]|uniref:hypothetical protein n=1 Tax=Streptomyces sp. NPDC020412 TaxID=3365073 RepID=UPI0037A0998E
MAIPGNYLSDTTSTITPNTSGWAVLLNCTLSKGVGGSVTDDCLQMTSVAAGEMRARTVASYPVIAGTEYEVFADAAGGTVPERIGLRWLTAANAEISISWSLTTSSAWASWHRIAVADWAPDTAAFVQVVFSAAPAAGVSQYLDNVYLGLPQRTTGNLLAATAETNERAALWEWGVTTNATLTRQAPPVGWSSTTYVAGGHVAAMTVTANGNANFRCTHLPEVTPGTEYLGYLHLNPPAAASTAWVELRFYDAGFTQIQATRSTLAAPGTGWYRQRVSASAPAGAAYATLAAGLDGATAGQVLRTDTAVITVAPVSREGSVVPYADSSFEQGIGAWTVVSGAATLARLTPWGTDSLEGSYCLAVTSGTAASSVIRSGRYSIGAAAGLSFRVESGIKVVSGSWTLTRSIRWYDAGGTDLGVGSGSPGTPPGPGWWLLSNDQVAPAGATQAAIEYTLTAGAAASVLRMDKVSLWQALPLTEAVADDVTASIRATFREVNTAGTISMWRVTPDGTRTPVRGADGLILGVPSTSDVVVIEDYEAPLGVPVYYYAETRTGTNLTSRRSTPVVTLTPGDRNLCWIKDPGYPQRNLQVMVKTPPAWKRPIQQTVYRVHGRANPVVHSDVRSGLEGDLVIYTRSDAEAAALTWVLSSGNPLLWQVVPVVHETDMYVSAAEVSLPRGAPVAGEAWREWTLSLTQVDMPTTVGVAGSAGRTWQDILTEHSTWQDVLDRFASWEDVFLNRQIGG